MKFLNCTAIILALQLNLLSATEFTISSYNCGGLTDHYDYLRAASMEKLMQERYVAEPQNMSLNEKIQQLALKILFSSDLKEQALARQEWNQKDYQRIFEHLTSAPTERGSINKIWNEKSEEMISTYKIRPVVIHDEEVCQILDEHVNDISHTGSLEEARKTMATRIFAHHLKHDIICLQEADYLDPSMFPENYEVLLADTAHSVNGIAWNRSRFELVNPIGSILGRAFAVQLRDKETNKTVLVASGHISGCNPYHIERSPKTGLSDSVKGDGEIQAIIDLFDAQDADLMLIGMDSNVTSLHPRLHILREAGYRLDYENFLDPTCTNPYQVLNTRIDWITLKSNLVDASITNIPVLSVGLNNVRTNISDHKPIAAKVSY